MMANTRTIEMILANRRRRERETVGATTEQLAALRRAMGGATTYVGTSEHLLFESLAERGWVKEATVVDGGVAWKLSGDGIDLAYGDER